MVEIIEVMAKQGEDESWARLPEDFLARDFNIVRVRTLSSLI